MIYDCHERLHWIVMKDFIADKSYGKDGSNEWKGRKRCMKKRLQIAALCALMVILGAFTVQAKSKIAATVYLREGDIANVCINYKYYLNTKNLVHKPVTALKVSNSSMATIAKNVLTVKRTGLFYITYMYRESGTRKTARIPVSSYKFCARKKFFDDISVKNYSKKTQLQLLAFSYNDREILTTFALINNKKTSVTKIKRLRLQLKAGNVKFFDHELNNSELANLRVKAGPYSKVYFTLKFLRSGITFDLSKVNNKNFGWYYFATITSA